jgi:hypothetical protein
MLLNLSGFIACGNDAQGASTRLDHASVRQTELRHVLVWSCFALPKVLRADNE